MIQMPKKLTFAREKKLNCSAGQIQLESWGFSIQLKKGDLKNSNFAPIQI